MTPQDLARAMSRLNETEEQRESRRLREIDALDRRGLATYSEIAERQRILRARALWEVEGA